MPDFLERDWNVKSERQFIASRRHAAVLLTKAFLRFAETETNDESAEQGFGSCCQQERNATAAGFLDTFQVCSHER